MVLIGILINNFLKLYNQDLLFICVVIKYINRAKITL
jgi:hypothetical protein